jgi:hypothetical protein
MQEDTDISFYIGADSNCNEKVIKEITKACAILTRKNSKGGKAICSGQ